MSHKSIVEERICSKEFSYLQPYFYKNPYALRCELGIGDSDEEYMDNARKRALEIYDILFPEGADCILFDHWIYDYCLSGEPEEDEDYWETIENRITVETQKLRFLSLMQGKYRHFTVRDLETYYAPEDPERERCRRNRVICYSDGKGFDHKELIQDEIEWEGNGVSFVSFSNECILSVYDDRGCDVVFMTHEKMAEFYGKLEPYFLDYDREEMQRRLTQHTRCSKDC